MKQHWRIWTVVLLVLLTLTACSENEETKEAEPNKTKDSGVTTKEPPEEEAGYDNVYPFTGIGTNETVNNRAVGVMINNHTKARPQSGLSKADIVFEILAEGKITRFLALFQSQEPEVVGPVRSAREYYFNLADSYDALYVYHGAAGFIDNMIQKRGIEHLNGAIYDNDQHLFKRESFRKAPHNSYLLFNAVDDVAASKGYATEHDYEPLPFLDEAASGEIPGDQADHVEIVYSNTPMEIVEFDYQSEEGTYTRFNDREQTVELNDETPISVENVFIVEAPHQIIDDAGRRAIDLDSGGNAFLIQKGKIQRIQWENRSGRLIPVKDGNPVGFVPGQTWVNVVPANPGIEQSVHISNE
ncbi:putative lipoprotein YerB [Lentibacillus sp. JNUCC-1]|uniref:DUF3048 domain-containing protein n=1 Tax=Lentibacillus sp. JNUCC-1 TaxID=2654513 RepID=UPI0012E961AE|nr:DUF3048 domain-containing protein [Lentibacillus sp. JNUCC-1]MUV38591.1 putative lipoprotein YerB [Lentibacillus sp. JNUCC-1]